MILSNYLLKILSSVRGWTHQPPTCFGFRGQFGGRKNRPDRSPGEDRGPADQTRWEASGLALFVQGAPDRP